MAGRRKAGGLRWLLRGRLVLGGFVLGGFALRGHVLGRVFFLVGSGVVVDRSRDLIEAREQRGEAEPGVLRTIAKNTEVQLEEITRELGALAEWLRVLGHKKGTSLLPPPPRDSARGCHNPPTPRSPGSGPGSPARDRRW